jgi:RNA polymerase sigma-70 factor (ECF subfamily)
MSGALTLLAEQDRLLWDRRLIAAGLRHLGHAAAGKKLTQYHLQAEIAALHVMAASDAETDWQAIAALYGELYRLDASPIVLLNRAVAVARWQGAEAGIRLLAEIENHPSLRTYHLLPAVLADSWRQTGNHHQAATYYQTALALTCTEPERQFLQRQLSQLESTGVIR